jgi:SepF-like predicted cell division protein (DUF552 family)
MEVFDFLLVLVNLVDSLIILFYTFYYYVVSITIDSYEDRLVKPSTHKKHKKIAFHSPQQQLCIKTTSVHDYSELKYLKESLTSTQSMILIAKIKPIVSKYPQAEDKLVNELYSSNAVRENYSIFQLGEERIIIIPNIVQTKDVLL